MILRLPRVFSVPPSLVAILALLTGCGESGTNGAAGVGDKARYAFITNGVAEFWTIAEAGAKQAGQDLGVEVGVFMPGSLTDQKQMMEDAVTRGYAGVAVSPIDPANQTEMLNQVASATKLVTHDSDAPESGRLAYIGMDNYTAGRLCGQLVREALPQGGEVMILIGRMEQDNSRKRRQGVIDELLGRPVDASRYDPPGEVIEGNGFTILGTLTDGFDLAKAKANAEDTLSRHPGLDAMIGLFAYNPPAILQALEQAGKLGVVKVIGFDEDDGTLAGIQSGAAHGTVVQNPYEYGYQSVKVLHALAGGDRSAVPVDQFIQIPGRQIKKDNVEAFWADLKAKTGK
ncbi:MAG: sugar ABC transporter substrate-binding protein [Verrucomicrobiia bacterium Tous-C2TDCM]|nr:MAG: sugar ABC transporter substrate-binding protein [Verrucomicrobiae bacterium Tous-C2TDCM]